MSNWRGMVPDYAFVGLKNYRTLFTLHRFRIGVKNNVIFTVIFIPASILLGFFMAFLLDQKVKFEAFFRNVFLFPMALSFVITGTVWAWIFNPQAGLNILLDKIGLGFLKSGWVTDPNVALYSIIIAATWQMAGFTMAMYLAGLRGIPLELREAAQVDGATEWQLYQKVIIPLLHPITVSAVVVLGHISLKIFDLIFVMTGGGPAMATDVPGVYMFTATFRQDLFNRGAAIGTIMLLMVAIVIVPYLAYSMRAEVER
ncbi:MAG: sugar ABC transporter permease [Firmicutes bacterium]|nr:sugar ABC transporter permease [Bacillota bacterium]